MKGKYDVERVTEWAECISVLLNASKSEAVKAAEEAAEEYPDDCVFVSTYNGQCIAYLNPDGNHGPVGEAW